MKIRSFLTFVLFITVTSRVTAQMLEYTLTTTAANITSAKALIDLPGLSGNTNAIIIATPLGNTKTINPNPTGAWYYSNKWNIFNNNYAVMVPGLTYKIQYFLTAGPDRFVHLVTAQSLGSEGSYIDNPALNNKPNAQFSIFQNHSPDVRPGSWLNQYEAKTGYSASAGKWFITNIGGQPLQKGCAYNVVMNTGSSGPSDNPGDTTGTGSCNCPSSLPPNGNAGGDLGGNYPNPTVKKLFGNPLSATTPEVGQVLKWNGTAWEPGVDNAATATSTTPAAAIQTFYKNGSNLNLSPVLTNYVKYPLTELNHTITVTKKSRLAFSAMIDLYGPSCPVGCSNGSAHWYLFINSYVGIWMVVDTEANSSSTATISNYMYDVSPGTYTIRTELHHLGNSGFTVRMRQSSVIVFPLE